MKIKRVINPSIYFFVFSGSVFLLGQDKSWWPSFYDPDFFGLAFLISAFLILLPRLILKASDEKKKNLVILLSSSIAIVTVLNALGQLYFYQLYQYGFHYDKAIHFADPLLFVIVLTLFLEIWYELPLKKALKISVVSVFAGCLLWEVYEFSLDTFFRTKEFGIYGQQKLLDTSFDILFDIIGILTGYFLLSSPKFSKKIDQYFRWPVLSGSGKQRL